MISALIVGAKDEREIALRAAILSATNFDAHLTSVQSGEDAVQILRSIRFEIVVADLRGGEEAASAILELLSGDRPQDLERLLLIADIRATSRLRGGARTLEGDEADLQMPSLGRSIARMMGDVVPEMRVWTR